MQDVIAAITTCPWSSSVSVPSSSVTCDFDRLRSATCDAAGARARVLVRVAASCVRRRRLGGAAGRTPGSVSSTRLVARVGLVVGQKSVERHPERRLGLGQRHAVLRALGPGQRRHDLAEVELQRLGVGRLLGVLVVPQPLLARVGLDELDPLGFGRPENSR